MNSELFKILLFGGFCIGIIGGISLLVMGLRQSADAPPSSTPVIRALLLGAPASVIAVGLIFASAGGWPFLLITLFFAAIALMPWAQRNSGRLRAWCGGATLLMTMISFIGGFSVGIFYLISVILLVVAGLMLPVHRSGAQLARS